MSIRLIVGLGNPGTEYEQTRHNAGFWLLDNLAHTLTSRWQQESRFQGLFTKSSIFAPVTTPVVHSTQEIFLLKPQTFMNRSGLSVAAVARFYKIPSHEILVVHDELDLTPGTAKLKKDGSAGGHNGLKDISAALGTQEYWRLRIGIGHPRSLNLQQGVVDYVLHRPRQEEQFLINQAISKSLNIIPLLCQGQFNEAMMQLHTD